MYSTNSNGSSRRLTRRIVARASAESSWATAIGATSTVVLAVINAPSSERAKVALGVRSRYPPTAYV